MRNRTGLFGVVSLALAAVLLTAAGPPACAGKAPASARQLPDLLAGTGLKYLIQDDTTAVLLLKGKSGVHVVTVRLLDQVLAAFAEVLAAREDRVPLPLWKKVAEVNARPSLAHVGYSRDRGKFYAVSGMTASGQATGPLLKVMVVDVASLADELQPTFRDLLSVE